MPEKDPCTNQNSWSENFLVVIIFVFVHRPNDES